ncbi:GGDEF domain-containing protein [Pseudomonas jessenii]|uniref:GGDEF domain-containing protein n=1 Tax=Pseudomonas jessenii TaxID=77298 RepID=UPI003891B6E2
MKLPSSKQAALARQVTKSHKRWITEILLVVTLLMTCAALLALHVAQEEMTSLSTPNQHNDLWYIVNISRELQRLEFVARHCLDKHPDYDELSTRLEVLQSLLSQDQNAPKISTRIIAALPEAQRILPLFNQQVDDWSQQLNKAPHTDEVPRQIIAQTESLSEQLSQVVLGVHLGTTQMLEKERFDLYQRFSLINWMLLALLCGMSVQVIKLIKDRHLLKRLSSHLGLLNIKLERRVARRTRQLAETKSLLIFILDASPSDVTLVNAETGEVYFINRRLLDRLGQGHEIDKLFITELLVDEQERSRFMEELDQYGRVDNWEAQIAPDNPYWSSLSVKLVEIEGKLSHLLWGYDVSKHRELRTALEIQASTDPMTGLYNRRAFYERSELALEICKRYKHHCSVLMLDIDHFKWVNDTHGHAVGDEALRWISRTLRTVLRDVDIIGRLGGEEFAVVLPHTDRHQALDTAERLRDTIAESTLTCHGVSLNLTVSVGLALYSQEVNSLENMLDSADKALYQAKKNGRNRVHA